MADINFDDTSGENETVALIELLFFAYRDFVSDPDAVLSNWALAGRTTGWCILSAATRA